MARTFQAFARARTERGLGQVWLHGKRLYACLLERRAIRRCGPDWTRLDRVRRGSWWRVWQLLRDELTPRITLAPCWDEAAWPQVLTALAERPRRRRLPTLSTIVVRWLQLPLVPQAQP